VAALDWFNDNEGLGTWLAAIGTVGALLLATGSQRMSLLDKRRAQASKVIFVVTQNVTMVQGQPTRYIWNWKIRNDSDGLITQVNPGVLDSVNDSEAADPGKVFDLAVRSLEPGTDWPGEGAWYTEGRASAFLDFFDTNGRIWRRHQDGRLEKRKRKLPSDLDYPQ